MLCMYSCVYIIFMYVCRMMYDNDDSDNENVC